MKNRLVAEPNFPQLGELAQPWVLTPRDNIPDNLTPHFLPLVFSKLRAAPESCDLASHLLLLKTGRAVCMAEPRTQTKEFVVGRFICPTTNSPAPLLACHPLVFLVWPVVVRNCPNCGREHVVQYEDVEHPPVFGYE